MVDRRSRAPAQAAAYRHAGVAAVARAAGSRARIRRCSVGSSGGGSGIARSRRGTRGSRGRPGPRRLVSGQARASIAGAERVARSMVASYPFGQAVCHGVAGRNVGVCVPRAGRGVHACWDGAARGGVRQRHGSGAPQPGRHGHADRDVPAVLRAVRVRGEVLQPVLGQREGQRGERGRVRAPQPGGAGPVGGGVPGVGDARGSTRANGSRRPTITGSACPSPACSNRRRSIRSRCRPPRSTRSSGVR